MTGRRFVGDISLCDTLSKNQANQVHQADLRPILLTNPLHTRRAGDGPHAIYLFQHISLATGR